MYEVGTLVLYGKRGVYKVESLGPPPVRGTTGDHYKLCAVFSISDEIIYIPVDGILPMRPLISSGEAAQYLELFAQLEPQAAQLDRTADTPARYRELLSSLKVEDCLLLVKELQTRQRELARQKKQLSQVDSRYLKLAEKMICEEFAVVLGTRPELIRERLYAVRERKATA